MPLRTLIRMIRTLGRGVAAGLPDAAESRDPLDLFAEWFDAAQQAGLLLPEAMTVATCTPDGWPSARVILLKEVGPEGFVFFTNYGSRKARELDANPRAALVFHWSVLQREVRVEGTVHRLSAAASDAYFQSRPRGSRLGAWASRQSDVLPDRRTLEERVAAVTARYEGAAVPLPPFWGGYRVVPHRIEFWQGRLHRLHDRLCFTRSAEGWEAVRLYP